MYVNVYVPKSGGSVVPKSDVYKCSDPRRHVVPARVGQLRVVHDVRAGQGGDGRRLPGIKGHVQTVQTKTFS